MKSNLDGIFKRDTTLEREGVWFEVSSGTQFLLRRFGGSNIEVKKAMLKFYKPYAKLIEKNLLPESKEKEVYVKAFVDSSLIDWKGVEIEGEEAPFTFDNAVKLLVSLPELTEALMEHSQDQSNFQEEVGN